MKISPGDMLLNYYRMMSNLQLFKKNGVSTFTKNYSSCCKAGTVEKPVLDQIKINFIHMEKSFLIRGCSYEKNQPGKTGCLGLPRSRLYYQFLIKIFELSYEKRAGPANRDLALFGRDPGKTGCFFLI